MVALKRYTSLQRSRHRETPGLTNSRERQLTEQNSQTIQMGNFFNDSHQQQHRQKVVQTMTL